jgi:hypothetical protein
MPIHSGIGIIGGGVRLGWQVMGVGFLFEDLENFRSYLILCACSFTALPTNKANLAPP